MTYVLVEIAPSPAFSVVTPRSDYASDDPLEPALPVRDATDPTSEIFAVCSSSEITVPEGVILSDDHAYLGHHKLPISSRRNQRTSNALITPSSLQYQNLSRDIYSKALPRYIKDRSESPEVLLWCFRENICPMLAMTDGENNMWQTLVLPLVHNSLGLYSAIAAISALHTSTEQQLRLYGTQLMGQCITELNRQLQGPKISGATLTIILILAYWARWNQGSNAGKIHLDGAIAALWAVHSQTRETALGSLLDDNRSLLMLVSNTCSYLDVLSFLVDSVSAIESYKV